MPNPTTPEMMPTKADSSPNVLEWILVVLVLVSLVGVGFLYMSLERLNASMVSTNAEVMEVKQELMEQKESAMMEEDVMEGEQDKQEELALWLQNNGVEVYSSCGDMLTTIYPTPENFTPRVILWNCGGDKCFWGEDWYMNTDGVIPNYQPIMVNDPVTGVSYLWQPTTGSRGEGSGFYPEGADCISDEASAEIDEIIRQDQAQLNP